MEDASVTKRVTALGIAAMTLNLSALLLQVWQEIKLTHGKAIDKFK